MGRGAVGWAGAVAAATDGATADPAASGASGASGLAPTASGAGAGVPGTATVQPVARSSTAVQISVIR